ncbi:hypothetical protein CEXT_567991 [Caerostris extrusa]|uniref:Uncharacterized protein n=1 Tax=Caerostris extrusa TaxID=172846 RepID=A0AAV4PVD2_CAEEX|nr:hypothetical protein CEXT_567991 [Caerostris extrusa]
MRFSFGATSAQSVRSARTTQEKKVNKHRGGIPAKPFPGKYQKQKELESRSIFGAEYASDRRNPVVLASDQTRSWHHHYQGRVHVNGREVQVSSVQGHQKKKKAHVLCPSLIRTGGFHLEPNR